jgi:uncharacterized integral membrane protein
MRALIRFIGLLLAAIIIAALAIFAAQNIRLTPLRYLGMSFTGNVWWICVGSAVLGFILAFLLLAPGRVVSGWRGRTLGRERTRLQDELALVRAREAQLRAEHEQLRARHTQLTAERESLRQSAATGASTETPVSAPGTSREAAPLVPPIQPVGSGLAAGNGAAPERPPTLGERLRGALGGVHQDTRDLPPDETGYPQGPTAPAS